MKILVTGSSGGLARTLLPQLLAHTEIEYVVGLDIKPSTFDHARLRTYQLDIRSPYLGEYMAGMNAVIHLAFVVMPENLGRKRKNRQLIHDINVNGSLKVCTTALQQGVGKIIYLSSAVIYGVGPNNNAAYHEQQPRQPLPGFPYAEDKVAVENWLDQFEMLAPHIKVIRLRPHVIIGPNATPLIKRILSWPIYPRFPDPQPLLQCISAEDVGQAVILALLQDVQGNFNLATEPPMSLREIQKHLHKKTYAVPFSYLCLLHRWAWRLLGIGGGPRWVEAMRYSLIIDSSKARQELGWQPMLNTLGCLDRMK